MRIKFILGLLLVMLLVVSVGCSAPAKTEVQGSPEVVATEIKPAEAAIKVEGVPANFPKSIYPLIPADAVVTETKEGSDGTTFMVMFTTELKKEEVVQMYTSILTAKENYTETPNDFGSVYQAADDDNAYTVAFTQIKDGKVNVVVTVY